MPEMQIKVDFSGPFFRAGLPAEKIDQAFRRATAEMVAEGETDVAMQLYPGHGLVTGHYRRSIHGDVIDSRHGVIHDSRVIYGPWLEGVSSRNQTTRFKGYAMFRNAFQRLQRKAQSIADKHFERAVKEMG